MVSAFLNAVCLAPDAKIKVRRTAAKIKNCIGYFFIFLWEQLILLLSTDGICRRLAHALLHAELLHALLVLQNCHRQRTHDTLTEAL